MDQRKKDLKTICLHNKAKLFEKKVVQSKEQFEDELNKIKRQILAQRLKERQERLERFMSTDIKGVNKFRSSLIYTVFIINFVSMLILQIDITSSL